MSTAKKIIILPIAHLQSQLPNFVMLPHEFVLFLLPFLFLFLFVVFDGWLMKPQTCCHHLYLPHRNCGSFYCVYFWLFHLRWKLHAIEEHIVIINRTIIILQQVTNFATSWTTQFIKFNIKCTLSSRTSTSKISLPESPSGLFRNCWSRFGRS